MPRFRLPAALIVAGIVGSAHPALGQTRTEGWTDRPDSRAPAGVNEDILLAPGHFEVRYNVELMSFSGLKSGTEDVPPELVLTDFDLAPTSMATQRHEIELRAGFLDWLGGSLRVPFVLTSAEFVNHQFRGNPSTSGIGDVEARILLGLHDMWPFRAHLIAGVSLPTGSVKEAGQLPDQPIGSADRTLPYPMQPGDGTFAILPGAVFVAENEHGTVGFQVEARVPVGTNDRGWTRGDELSGQVWMAHRFTDWVSGSLRVSYTRRGDLSGADTSIYAFSSPMAYPDLQGGTTLDVPIGINIRFPEGRLQGSRLSFELIIPAHQNPDGPQLTPSSGATFSWGIGF
jgi:hypothetical protein